MKSNPVGPPPLDPQLLALSQSEAKGSDMPLAIKRFTNVRGVSYPTEAMCMATIRLLESYAGALGYLRLPISVERLSLLCGAELVGSRPSSRLHSSYSGEEYRSRAGHTGKLYLRDSQVMIRVPEEIDFETARISVAHEIGHILIHQRGTELDHATIRLSSTSEEEALAEYGGRLLLLPTTIFQPPLGVNLAQYAVEQAGVARVTVHSAVSRLGDPDILVPGLQGAILWRINPQVPASHPISTRLTPQWHLCPGAFVPVRRSKARPGCLVAQIAEAPGPISASSVETVSIGTFVGVFRVDAFAWGAISQGTRLVLSVFRRLCES